MGSTLSLTRADRLLDEAANSTVSKDAFIGLEVTVARLAYQAAGDSPDAWPRRPESRKPADARISQSSKAPPSSEAPALGPADISAQIPREQLGKRGTLVRVAIAVCLAASAIWAGWSYGGAARHTIAGWAAPFIRTSARHSAQQAPVLQTPNMAAEQAAAAPAVEQAPPPAQTALQVESPAALQVASPAASQAASQAAPVTQPVTTAANEPATVSADHQQMEAMARDVAALRQTIGQLTAGQAQLKAQIAKLHAERSQANLPPAEKPKRHHVAAAEHHPDAFNPAQDPNAPGAPRSLGSIVVPGAVPQVAPAVSTMRPLPPSPMQASQH
jgi:hypothetical protein